MEKGFDLQHDDDPLGLSKTYLPIMGLPYWNTIGPFITHAVSEVAEGGRDLPGLYSAITPFVLWCWQSRGIDLREDRIFRRTLADQFIHLATPTLSPASKATHRGALWRAIEILNPHDTSVSGLALPRSTPTIPYNDSELAQLQSWALAQSTAARRQDAGTLLALGLGAGLATREILEVTVSDVTIRPRGMFVSVWASRPRTVPVLAEWSSYLRASAELSRGQEWVFAAGRGAPSSDQVSEFLARARSGLDIRVVRMRATWLRRHLADGMSPIELMQISGIHTLAGLQNSLNFAPTTGHKMAKRGDHK
ncbi:hypothetical protein FB472_0388 [Rhodoglobus vestalii]|uniref:Phage integrase family protein n=1 Tax=Rhodoglobus vestalii TaxID=193384 RepID=A0A8H2PT46_9MICO|nr:phage integrase family protein [Rhodoglobus vestalii]TQO18861.1 hypothetical protein FB472_0388 [Rhodoglobus vestalii]